MEERMTARRSLRLDETLKNQDGKTQMRKLEDPSTYSPITGTRRLSPPSVSKLRAAVGLQEVRRPDDAGPKNSSRGQSSTEEDSEILERFLQVEQSLDMFLIMREDLKNVLAIEGSSELEEAIGMEQRTLDLKSEMEKVKVLICEVRKRKRQKKTG